VKFGLVTIHWLITGTFKKWCQWWRKKRATSRTCCNRTSGRYSFHLQLCSGGWWSDFLASDRGSSARAI